MTARTFKKKSSREIRLERTASAAVAIGEIKHGEDVFILTYGQFSLIDVLIHILQQTGEADVVISTWTAANAHLDEMAEMMDDKNIRSLKMIVDRSFKTRQPKYFANMVELFGEECFVETTTHAKFMLIGNKDWNIVVRTSMNLNTNKRLENIEISDDKCFYNFLLKASQDMFYEGSSKTTPKLESIDDTSNFKTIQAKTISLSTLKEAAYATVIETKNPC